ncbi:MAG: threonine/serine exporter family protein [Actinomycetaceae bacterium]|nr:threonine/serine exporter family protein [Arcanobacterium sp.]MDD7686399.1 threonine/serine exporter family protein [Actinomycetaceae bacterium]MDY5272679.1 threonine/serine exporter family protein [Arcanobacterium sp.]
MNNSVNSNGQSDLTAAHTRLAHQIGVVLHIGLMMLSAGASSYRVKDAMERLAHAVGIDRMYAQVTYTEISVTAYANGTFRTEIAEQRVLGVNADRIDALDHFVNSLPPRGLLAEDAEHALSRIERRPPLYSIPLSSFLSGLACAAFAFLNKGGFPECIAVFIAAVCGQCVRRFMVKRHMNHFGTWFACGVVASAVYIAVISAGRYFALIDATHQTGVVAALLFLVPGFPLVTAILDLIRQDFSAGISRSVYVAMLMFSSAMAVWCVTAALQWSTTSDIDGYTLSVGVLLGARAVASFIASFGFASLFNAPLHACLIASINGAIINTFRLTLQDTGFSWLAAVGLAAFAAGLFAQYAAHFCSHSRVSLSVPAVVLMIPGVPFYRALSAMSNGSGVLALGEIVTIALVISAIGCGLAGARMVTDSSWRVDRSHGLPKLKGSEQTIPPAPHDGWQAAPADTREIPAVRDTSQDSPAA